MTIGGHLDLAYGTSVIKDATGAKATVTGVQDGALKPNSIFFKGEEVLGGGLKAGFVVDQGISPTQKDGFNVRHFADSSQLPGGGTGSSFTTATMRQGNVYVAGGFGEVRVGQQYRSAYGVTSKTIVLAETFGGAAHTIAATRTNAVSYTSPSFSGVTAQVQYGSAQGQHETQESVADTGTGFRTDNTKVVAGSLNYNQGPLWVGAAYEYVDILRVANAAATVIGATGVPSIVNAYGAAVAQGTAANQSEKLWTLGGSYDFGVAKLNAFYGNKKTETAAGGQTTAKAYAVSAIVPVGAFDLAAIYSDTKTRNDVTGVETNDVKGYQVGAKYNLSKRTQVYLLRAHDKDETAAAATDRTRTLVGLNHSF